MTDRALGRLVAAMSVLLALAFFARFVGAQSIRAVPDSAMLTVGDSVRITSVVRNGAGQSIAGTATLTAATGADVATLRASGWVVARAPGCRTFYVTHAPNVKATVPVCVVAKAPVVPVVAPPVPEPTGPAPVLVEDFSSYADLAQFLTNPRGIYSTLSAASEGNEVFGRDHFSLSSPGYDGSPHALRLTFPDRTASSGRCHDYSVGVNLTLPAPAQEVWVEVTAMYSANFTTRAPVAWSCASNPDHKFIFGRVSGSGRFGLNVGTGGNQWTWGYPGNENNEFGGPAQPFDGQWHTYRLHMRAGSAGAATFWYDGALVRRFTNIATTASNIYGLAIGRNLNQGPAAPQSLTVGRVRVYTANPGW